MTTYQANINSAGYRLDQRPQPSTLIDQLRSGERYLAENAHLAGWSAEYKKRTQRVAELRSIVERSKALVAETAKIGRAG